VFLDLNKGEWCHRVNWKRSKQQLGRGLSVTEKGQGRYVIDIDKRRKTTRERVKRYRREHPDYYRAELETRRGSYKPRNGVCEVCGYGETVDLHHEGEEREEHILCPNCHALITRKLATLEGLLNGSNKGTEENLSAGVYAEAKV